MSYLDLITADTKDDCLDQLVQDSMGDQWWTLNDLEQSRHLYDAYEYRQALSDQKAINDLLAMQPRSSSTPTHSSFTPHSSIHSTIPSLPLDAQRAMQPTMPPPQHHSFTSVRMDELTISRSCETAHTVASYTRELFRHVVTHADAHPHPKPSIPLQLPYFMIEDAQHIAELTGNAYSNRRRLPWTMSKYAEALGNTYTGRAESKEDALDHLFPHGAEFSSDGNHFDKPMIIVDEGDNVLAWYLPDIISRDAHSEWQDSIGMLNSMIKEEPKNRSIQQKFSHNSGQDVAGLNRAGPSSWRIDPRYFSAGAQLSPGVANMASCWFQAGHFGGINRPEVSKSLKSSSSSAPAWLRANIRFQSIIGSVLAVTHPGQYNAGTEMLKALTGNPTLLREPMEISKLDSWNTPFSGVSIICNRQTPPHRDIYGRHDWYDVLATMGTHPTINFGLPGLRTTLAYSPRTIVALCGRILTHTVDSTEHGDRACFAWFMRDDVREYLNVDPGAPSTLANVITYSA